MVSSVNHWFSWWPLRPTQADQLIGRWRVATVGILLGLAAGIPAVAIPGIPVKPYQLLVVAAFVIAVWPLRTAGLRGIRFTAFEITGALFVAVSLVAEFINSSQLHYKPDVVSFLTPLLMFAGFLTARSVVNSREKLELFLSGFSLTVAPLALLAWAQGAFPTQFLWITDIAPSPGVEARIEDDRLLRAGGLIGHWTGLGYYLTAMLLVLCMLLILRNVNRRGYGLIILAIVAVAIGLTGSLTLAPFLTSIAILVFTLFQLRLPLVASIPASLFVLATSLGSLIFLPGFRSRLDQQAIPAPVVPTASPTPTPTSTGGTAAPPVDIVPDIVISDPPAWLPSTLRWRWRVWESEAIPAINDRPWTGWGGGVYESTSTTRLLPDGLDWPSAESQWIWASVTRGIPAALVLFALIVVVAVMLIRSMSRRTADIVLPLLIALVLFAAGSVIAPIFTNHGLPLVLWPLVGAVLAAVRPEKYALPFRREDQRADLT